MGFTTSTFIFCFLPIFLICYFLFSKNGKRVTAGNIVIAIGSFIFYSWALATSAVMLFLYTIVVYVIGRLMSSCVENAIAIPIKYYRGGQEQKETRLQVAKILLILGVIFSICLLYHFKYASTAVTGLSKYFYINTEKYSQIITPLGISFITFSSISYFTDIYYGKAHAGSFLDCMIYIYFFPKVVSGPIVLWRDFESQLHARNHDSRTAVCGINRICIGFAKKVILADTFGHYTSKIQSIAIDTPTAWLGWILYALQIYYDFAGYSDIAIGISEMLGFHFDDNFNFPYRSLSVSEFWRRWHISLGNFFKNYIYFPLGGNRRGKNRTLINLGIVFFVSGIWHGVGLAYIVWGCIHGICVIIERVIKDKKFYQKTPKIIRWSVTFFIVASAWQFFRYGDLVKAMVAFSHMIGIHSYSASDIIYPFSYYLDNKIITLLVTGIFGATVLGSERIISLYSKIKTNTVWFVFQEIMLLGLFIVALAMMISSGYSPFIYFQF